MIGFILGSAGALLIGIVIGHTWGERSVRKKFFAPDNNVAEIHLKEISVEPRRLQIAREVDIPPLAPRDLKCALLRETERAIQESALDALKRHGFLSPREVFHAYGTTGFERYRLELSLMVAKAPEPDEPSLRYEKPQIFKATAPDKDCKRGV